MKTEASGTVLDTEDPKLNKHSALASPSGKLDMQIATLGHSKGWRYSTQSYGGSEIGEEGGEVKRG